MCINIKTFLSKDIEGYEGLYKIDEIGNIWSYPKHKHRGKFLKQILRKDGYMEVGLTKNKTRKTFIVHRLVAKTFIENKNNKKEVNHKDGIKTNNNALNLEWVTSSENQIHAIKNGLQAFTEKHRISAIENGRKNGMKNKGVLKIEKRKTTELQDQEIIEKLKNGTSSSKLATEYAVSKKTILNIKNNRKYKKGKGCITN